MFTKTVDNVKHQFDFRSVINEVASAVYVYGVVQNVNVTCDEEMPCWLDDLSQLKCDPEWWLTYGWMYQRDVDSKKLWYAMWRTVK